MGDLCDPLRRTFIGKAGQKRGGGLWDEGTKRPSLCKWPLWAGIVGTAVVRELSRYKLDLLLIEAEPEVSWGSTKANSGIVHGGFHEEPGTLKAKYCLPGNQMYPELCRDLDVCFEQNGILMLAAPQRKWTRLGPISGGGQSAESTCTPLKPRRVLARNPIWTQELQARFSPLKAAL